MFSFSNSRKPNRPLFYPPKEQKKLKAWITLSSLQRWTFKRIWHFSDILQIHVLFFMCNHMLHRHLKNAQRLQTAAGQLFGFDWICQQHRSFHSRSTFPLAGPKLNDTWEFKPVMKLQWLIFMKPPLNSMSSLAAWIMQRGHAYLAGPTSYWSA